MVQVPVWRVAGDPADRLKGGWSAVGAYHWTTFRIDRVSGEDLAVSLSEMGKGRLMQVPKTADAVVIGGGILGASTAHFLATLRDPARRESKTARR